MNIFNIYLPLVQRDFNFLLLILIGFFGGVLGGFFGGGGWIVTSALNIFGFNMSYTIGTDISQIFASSIIGTKKHSILGNVDWELGFFSITGSILGVEAGAQTVMILENYNYAGNIIRIIYLILLFGVGIFMLYDYLIIRKRNLKNEPEQEDTLTSQSDSQEKISLIAKKVQSMIIPPMISFKTSNIKSVSLWIVLIIFFFSGFFSGLIGVGTGFMIMPSLIYLLGCPTIIAVGTSLMSVCASSAYGTFSYAFKGRVDLIASLYIFIGASIGIQFGVAAVKYIKGYGIRFLFALIIIFVGLSVLLKQLDSAMHLEILKESSNIIIFASAVLVSLFIIHRTYPEFRRKN